MKEIGNMIALGKVIIMIGSRSLSRKARLVMTLRARKNGNGEEKKRAQKLAATKAPKVDDVEQIRKGLEALDFNKEDDDVEMGLKFESQKKTVSAFAAGVSDERFRRDWSIRQIVRGVYFDVINQDMQDDDYVINNNIVKVRTVSDKYCFFKSLLNVCKLP